MKSAKQFSGLDYAYLAGKAIGVLLPLRQMIYFFTGNGGIEPLIVETLFGVFLLLPWKGMVRRNRGLQPVLLFGLITFSFIFYLVIHTLLKIMAMIEVGLRPGVPAFEGVLVFFVLMQIPVLVFMRRPELLD